MPLAILPLSRLSQLPKLGQLRRRALAAGLLAAAAFCGPAAALTVEPVHMFKGSHRGGVDPLGGLLQASDGNLWGTTSAGGKDDDGIVFKMSLDGDYESVTGVPLSEGRGLVGDLVQSDDGTLWAVAQYGGDNDGGSILAIGLDGSVSLVYSFNPGGWGGNPDGGLVKAPDGFLYGLIPGANAKVYRVDPVARAWSIVATLPNNQGNCQEYDGRLAVGTDGALYAAYGGQYGCVVRATPRGTAKIIHYYRKGNFGPRALVGGSDGNLYGVAFRLARKGICADVFRMTPTGKSSTVKRLPCTNDYDFPFSISQASDGMLYGSSQRFDGTTKFFDTLWTVSTSGAGYAEVRMRKAGGGASGVIQASDGALYATVPGGKYEDGMIVRITP